MNFYIRILVLTALGTLAACTNVTQRQYEACIAGISAAGGVIGGGVGGVAAGVGVSAVVCGEAQGGDDTPERAVVAAAAVDTTVGDSDGDGVTDDVDRCPNTPAGAAVDRVGCLLDQDGDGVPNSRDSCANTPRGVEVDASGCPVKDEVVLTVDRLGFEFDSSRLDAQSRSALDAAVDVIQSHSSVQLDVVGYTDNVGSDDYNQGLSERRAQAAVDYLVSQGIPRSQLRPLGRGESSPVASNDTEDGRARNRRVELVVR